MFSDFLGLATKSQMYKQPYLDDFFDSLSYRYASMALLFSMSLVLFKQYFMEPITCYLSTPYGGENIMDYVQSYCFVEGTIALSDNFTIPTKAFEWKKLSDAKKTRYYQWVPLLLGVQAIMFYLPHVLWKMLNCQNRQSQIKKIIEQANEAKGTEGDIRKQQIIRLTKALESLLFENSTNFAKGCKGKLQRFSAFITLSKRNGKQMFDYYIFIKFLYMFNSFSQIVIMNKFLSWDKKKYSFLGYGIIADILSGTDWQYSLIFPRVAYCIIPLRSLAGINHVLAQCALPINMLHEKIYVFLWILCTILSFLTLFSFSKILLIRFLQKERTEFIKKYLKLTVNFRSKEECQKKLKRFEENIMKNDGIYLLNIISRHSGDVITGEIVRQLWEKFKDNNNQINESAIVGLCKKDRPTLYRQMETVDPTAPLMNGNNNDEKNSFSNLKEV